jgi:hypothetical protein
MSKIILGSIAPPNANLAISVPPTSNLIIGGSVIQTVMVRSDTRTTFSALNSGQGTTITNLNLTVAPKRANSLLVMTWQISGESNENVNFLIHRNGNLILDSGYEGLNGMVGNTTIQCGYTTSWYDADVSTTPTSYIIRYAIVAANTTSQTYAPAVRSSSNGSSYTFYLNRCVNNEGTTDQENGISTGVLQEVATG